MRDADNKPNGSFALGDISDRGEIGCLSSAAEDRKFARADTHGVAQRHTDARLAVIDTDQSANHAGFLTRRSIRMERIGILSIPGG